jgi:hypothetical protein
MSEDRHIILARALLARLHAETDWTSAIAGALRAERAAVLQEAAAATRATTYPQGGQNDEWHGAMLMRDYCEFAILALIPKD